MATRARDSHGKLVKGAGSKNIQVTDRDHGYAALKERLEQIRGSRIAVGLHAKEGQATHKEAREAAGGDQVPPTVLDIGTWAEFGIGQPERSWLRAWYDAANEKSKQDIRTMLKAVVAGKLDAASALNKLGARFAGQIQQRIADGIQPDNAESTILKKGSSTPLINTGQFRSSITWSVELGESGGEGLSAAAE